MKRSAIYTVREYLETRGRCYDIDQTSARLRIWGKSACFAMTIRIFDDKKEIVILSRLGIQAPPVLFDRVTLFLTRANYALHFGCFELDYADGEIRFRHSHIYEDSHLNPETVHNLIETIISTCDLYMYGLLQILYDPLADIQKTLHSCEGDTL